MEDEPSERQRLSLKLSDLYEQLELALKLVALANNLPQAALGG